MFARTPVITRTQNGISLLELLIAMVIGLLVTGGAIQLFITNKATYRVENALSRMQESGRYIIDAMGMEIRMAGYNGCSSRGNITPNLEANVVPPAPYSVIPDDAVRGEDAVTADNWYQNALSSSDAITIQKANECSIQLIDSLGGDPATTVRVQDNICGLNQDDVVMITNCSAADVFMVQNTPAAIGGGSTTFSYAQGSGPSNLTGALASTYGTDDSQLAEYEFQAFYIAPSSTDADDGIAGNDRSLWTSIWQPTADATFDTSDVTTQELAPGVEQMQIEYGIDNAAPDEYADTYLAAAAVTDWSQVRSVRINLLLHSDDGITTEPRTITFNGASEGGVDNRLRMVYSSTISLRNRLP